MARLRRSGGESLNPWPGYVDALSTLLMVIIFVLLVFVLAQAFLTVSLSGRQQALERLSAQVTALSSMLALEKDQESDLRARVAQTSRDLRVTVAERDTLTQQLGTLRAEAVRVASDRDTLRTERDQLTAKLAEASQLSQATQQRLAQVQAMAAASASSNQAAEQRAMLADQRAAAAQAGQTQAEADLAAAQSALTELRAQVQAMRRQAEEADRTVQTDRATLEAKLSEIADLSRQVEQLPALRDQLARQAQQAQDAATRVAAEQQKRATAEAQLADAQKLADSDRAQLALMAKQIGALRDQLAGVQAALGTAQAQAADKDARIADLGQKLNVALSQKVQELQRYRSEFFGRLSEVLANRPGIQVVGDRFVFQSEVLFPPGSDQLNGSGQEEIRKLAATLKDIARDIPPDVNWLLRVDGHADRQPVDPTGNFVDNWDLSAKRAINVAKLLIAQGLPPNRVAATAFGDTQPIDPADTPEAYAKNRRIEIRLTDR